MVIIGCVLLMFAALHYVCYNLVPRNIELTHGIISGLLFIAAVICLK